jgi:hypothetical protein
MRGEENGDSPTAKTGSLELEVLSEQTREQMAML